MGMPEITKNRALFVFDSVILTSVGGMAFGGSASHVYRLAREHGQQHFGALSVTCLAEILFAYEGLEVRRRNGKMKLIPVFWLIICGAFIIWANLKSTNDHTLTGYIIAVAPAVIFAGVASTAETRNWGAGKVEDVADRGDGVHTDLPSGEVAPDDRPADDQDDAPPPEVAAAPPPQPRRKVAAARRAPSGRQRRQAEIRAVGRAWAASQDGAAPMDAYAVAARLQVTRQRAGQLIDRWRSDPASFQDGVPLPVAEVAPEVAAPDAAMVAPLP